LQGVAICDIDSEVCQQRLQELKEEYGEGRVIFIEVDVRNYQQFEGDRNLLLRAENVTINIVITRLTKKIRSGITFVSRNVISRMFL